MGFFGAVFVGVTSAGVLEHKGTLYETFLFCEVFVTDLTIACMLASFGTFELYYAQVNGSGIG